MAVKAGTAGTLAGAFANSRGSFDKAAVSKVTQLGTIYDALQSLRGRFALLAESVKRSNDAANGPVAPVEDASARGVSAGLIGEINEQISSLNDVADLLDREANRLAGVV